MDRVVINLNVKGLKYEIFTYYNIYTKINGYIWKLDLQIADNSTVSSFTITSHNFLNCSFFLMPSKAIIIQSTALIWTVSCNWTTHCP